MALAFLKFNEMMTNVAVDLYIKYRPDKTKPNP